MHPRLRLVLIASLVCAFAGLAGVWIATLTVRPARSEASANGIEGALRPPGAMLPSFRLKDQDERLVSPNPAKDKLAIYTFIYTSCDDVCALLVQQIRGALDEIGRDVPVYGISVDPKWDTAAAARTFVLEQHMTGRMKFLVGKRAELQPVWDAFGISPQGTREGDDHSAAVVIVDGAGRQRVGYNESMLSPSALAADLRRLGA